MTLYEAIQSALTNSGWTPEQAAAARVEQHDISVWHDGGRVTAIQYQIPRHMAIDAGSPKTNAGRKAWCAANRRNVRLTGIIVTQTVGDVTVTATYDGRTSWTTDAGHKIQLRDFLAHDAELARDVTVVSGSVEVWS